MQANLNAGVKLNLLRRRIWTGVASAFFTCGAVGAGTNPLTIGGGGPAFVRAVCAGPQGGWYVAGGFDGMANFGRDSLFATSNGDNDAFIGYVDFLGTVNWVKTFGGIAADNIDSMVATSDGGVCFVGRYSVATNLTSVPAFDADPGPGVTMSPPNAGMMVGKFSSAGTLEWIRFLPSDPPYAAHLRLTSNGDLVIAGTFQHTVDFDPGAGVAESTTGPAAMFVLRLSPTGDYRWHRVFASAGGVVAGLDLVVTPSDDIVVCGDFNGTVDFDPGPGTQSFTPNNGDGMALALTGSGDFKWVRILGGNGIDIVRSVVRDSNGDLIFGAQTTSTDLDADPGAGVFRIANAGELDGLVWRLTANGDFVWARSMGGTGTDTVGSVTIESDGTVVASGLNYKAAQFPGGQTVPVGGFLWALNRAGDTQWVRSFASDQTVTTEQVVWANNSLVAVGEVIAPTDFDPAASVVTLSPLPAGTITPTGFILLLNQDGLLAPLVFYSPSAISGRAGTAVSVGAPVVVSPLPVTFTAAALPPGLSVSSSTGAITGIPTQSGTFTSTITAATSSGSRAATLNFQLAADPKQRLLDLAGRASLGPGRSAIAGLVIKGTGPREVLIRVVGPTLRRFGVNNPAENPFLMVQHGDTVIAGNDDWGATSNLAEYRNATAATGAFALDEGSKDAGVVATLSPGDYTVIALNTASNYGVALLEVYDVLGPIDAQLVNISIRATSAPGENQAIAGFVIGGSAPKRVLIRAIGPSLAGFGVTDVHPHPKLQLVDKDNVELATADGWDETKSPDVKAAIDATGAFQLPATSNDTALVAALPPGSYTALASATDAEKGSVLLEIYEVP